MERDFAVRDGERVREASSLLSQRTFEHQLSSWLWDGVRVQQGQKVPSPGFTF